MLKLTERELAEIVEGDFKRFKVLKNELENEKNGRKDFECKFEDTQTSIYYELSYSHHSDGYYTFFDNDKIKIVSTSDINKEEEDEEEITQKKKVTVKEKTNRELYYENKKDCSDMLVVYMKKPSYFFTKAKEEIKNAKHIDELYDSLYKFCYENKIEAQSFLEYIQDTDRFLLKLKLQDEKYPKIIQNKDDYNISLNENLNIKLQFSKDRFIISEDNNFKELDFFDISKGKQFSDLSEALSFCYQRIERTLKKYSSVTKPTFKKYIEITSFELKRKEKEKKEELKKEKTKTSDLYSGF